MFTKIRVFFFCLIGQMVINLSLAFIAAAQLQSAANPKLTQITPSGDLNTNDKVTQIVLQYDGPVVPLGKMDREPNEIPVLITPELNCQWRWLDQSNLACQISTLSPVKPATTYTVKVSKSDAAPDKLGFTEAKEVSFTMERPEVTYSFLNKYLSPVRPSYYVQTNVPVNRSSLARHLYFLVSGEKRYAVDLEELEHSPYDGEGYVDNTFQKGTWWLASPDRDLPAEQSYELMSEAGIRPVEGSSESTEEDRVIAGATFGDFKFSKINCTLTGVPGADPLACVALNPIALDFTAPVTSDQIKKALLIEPNPYGENVEQWWEQMSQSDTIYESHTLGNTYGVSLPGPLKSEMTYKITFKKGSITDSFGRPLEETATVDLKVAPRDRRVVRPPVYSTLESQEDTSPAIYLTNVKKLNFKYESVNGAGEKSSGTKPVELSKVRNLSYKLPLPIKQVLDNGSGLLVGWLLGGKLPTEGDRAFFVQRTPFSVHVKTSPFNSLVWVTDSKTGDVVKGATVDIVKGRVWNLLADAESGGSAVTDSSGLAILPGLNQIDPQLDYFGQWDSQRTLLIARVRRGSDVAVVPLSYDFRVYTEIYPYIQKKYGTIKTWGTTAQGIYRAGDNLQFKIFVRNSDNDSFILPPKGTYQLTVIDPLEKKVYEKGSIALSELGTFADSFEIPKSAAVGWYSFSLKSNFTDKVWEPMRVLVSDFTPAPFKVTLESDRNVVHENEDFTVRTASAFHAGGAYGGAKSRISVTAEPIAPNFPQPALDAYTFNNGESASEREVFRHEFVMPTAGEEKTNVELTEQNLIFGQLRIESVVADERGKNIAGYLALPYFGRERFAGVKTDTWLFDRGKENGYHVVVVNEKGEFVPGAKVSLTIERDRVSLAEVKSAGSAYLPEYTTEKIVVSQQDVVSGAVPLEMKFIPTELGNHRFIAKVVDAQGREHSASFERWVVGSGEMLWRDTDDEKIKVDAEKKTYAIGETAKFLVHNPFPGAQALITIERDGVIAQRIERLNDAASIVEVPVESRFAPGFYLSVVIMSPRVAAPIEKGVDLGKPAFRAGYASVSVPKSDNQLRVAISSDRPHYQPGEEVTLDLTAQDDAGKPLSGELAVTVLDEAVFDLIVNGKSLYDIYSAFYQLDSLGVANFNLLRQIVGRQNFERKGMSDAGDGGRGADLRSIDKFVAYWNPQLKVGANGKAQVKFAAPSNLTAWKVFAMALNRGNRMGNGESSFAVSKDIEVRPVNPQIARIGDTFIARFSIMNRTQAEQRANVLVRASGGATAERSFNDLVIAPSERRIVEIELAPSKLEAITLETSATAGSARDGLKVTIPVLSTTSNEHVMQTVSIEKPEEKVTLQVPAHLRAGEGKMQVSLFPSIVGDLAQPFDYMRLYPYSCWEQRTSKAMMAAWFSKGGNNLRNSYQWSGAGELVGDYFKSAPEFQCGSGGMAYYKPIDEFCDPYLSAYTALAFTWLKELGYEPPQQVAEKLKGYLSNLMKSDPQRARIYDPGAMLTVRVMALRALASSGDAKADDALRLLPLALKADVFTQALMLETLSNFKLNSDTQALLKAIQSRANLNADSVQFNDSYSFASFRVLASSVRGNCQVLSALSKPGLTQSVNKDWLHKLVRGVIKQKTARDHWSNTQENVFCVNALRQYAKLEGSFDAPLEISAAIETGVFGSAKFTNPTEQAKFFERPLLPVEIGVPRDLILRKSGSRTGYATVGLEFPQASAGPEGRNVGIEVYREYSIKSGDSWKVIGDQANVKIGDVVRVDLYVVAPAGRAFVVLEDKLPGAFEVINRNLATSSASDSSTNGVILPDGSKFAAHKDLLEMGSYYSGFVHVEQRNESVRFYSEYLEPGKYHLTHFVQAIAPGTFTAPSAHGEEMYVPAVYGESSEARFAVKAE